MYDTGRLLPGISPLSADFSVIKSVGYEKARVIRKVWKYKLQRACIQRCSIYTRCSAIPRSASYLEVADWIVVRSSSLHLKDFIPPYSP